jgi:hypothetical protein
LAIPDDRGAGTSLHAPRGDRDRVLQHLAGRAYAVLDGARDPRVARLHTGSTPSWCLYRGNLPPALADAAPHLFHLRAGHDYADIFFRVGWRNAWGILVASDAEQPLLYRHLRTLLRVRSEERKSLVFRYYDPRILREYLPSCTPEEMDRFFGPISSAVVEGEDEGDFHLFRRTGDGFEHLRVGPQGSAAQVQTWAPAVQPLAAHGPMVLRTAQLEALADPALREYQERMIAWIAKEFPDDFQRLREKGVRRLVLKAKQIAAGYGMVTNVEVTSVLSLMLVLHDEDFETREVNEWMRSILRNGSIPGAQKARFILRQRLDSI